MKKFLIFFLLFVGLILPESIFAQELDAEKDDSRTLSEEAEDSEDASSLFEVDVSIGIQSVFNNKVPIIVDVTPNIDSSRAQVDFKIPGGFNRDTSSSISFEMEEGVPRQFKLELEPIDPGDYNVVVEVTAWRYDSNYVNSDEINFSIDERLLVSPVSKEYQNNKLMLSVVVVVLSLACAVGMFFLGKFLYKKYKHVIIPNKKA